jgi:hypothetical protein
VEDDEMEKKQNFIRTTSHETAQKLLSEGFTLVSNNGGEYVFLNNGSHRFDDGNLKLMYTNILTF